jgi:hypothetical protein
MNNPLLGTYAGIRIVETETVGDPYDDWSQVRSPSRAIRRLRRGFKQRIVTRFRANGKSFHDTMRNVIYIHPHDAIILRQAMINKAIEGE